MTNTFLVNKDLKKKPPGARGFTLIEILVVFSLIGVLLSISFVAFSTTRKSARDSKRKADLEQLRSALEIYRSDLGEYIDYSQECWEVSPGQTIAFGGVTYMESTPGDPLYPTYGYVYNRTGDNSYNLCAHLEMGATANLCGNCACGTGQVCNYRASNP